MPGDDTPSEDGSECTTSMRVLETIGEADGVDPIDLEPPLNDVVDASALDLLFEPTTGDDMTRHGRVSFTYRTHDVTVYSDGRVELE
ncbi:hypothetical protein CV102_19800 [Natronococcus pandeyae]|uniref:Halobacterial output domain-containing protein n=1 Tax=Natronococcus pandeyae TaxID=2055836 RepID=A0A8J8TP37_9EURY|nr:HalOD1 output domain-containing protein [Natronococcus pandeyae]TYL36998.1 hypothetical protein CV102_19800 [Natronococcus pandeyae]